KAREIDNSATGIARILLASESEINATKTLAQYNYLELSIPAIVLKPQFSSLFTETEIEQAQKILTEIGYDFKKGIPELKIEGSSFMSDLEAQFQNAMLKLYDDSNRAINYRPTRLMEMSNELGAVQAARQLISKPDDPSSGFMKLWESGRLDLSVEALILKPEFAPLFTDEERKKARQYLLQYNY